MSVSIPIDLLSKDKRVAILKELHFKFPINNGRSFMNINAYHIENNTMHLPFAYALNLGLKQPSKSTFRTINPEFKGELREYQEQVKRDAITRLNKTGSCVLSLYCGFGKTITAIYLACRIKLPTVILVNRVVLAKQWVDSIRDFCPDAIIQFLSPKDTINENADFYIINAINVSKFPEPFLKSIGMLIIDELHLICAKTLYKSMFHIEPKYVLGLSATPYRPDGLDALINTFFGDFRLVKELDKKHTVYAIKTNLQLDFNLNPQGRIDWNSILNSQAEHPERNELIMRIVAKYPERNFLILVKRISQGKHIVEQLKKVDTVTDLLGSRTEYDHNARILVATCSKVGVGFSCDKLDTLLLATDLQEYFIQFLGRVFRRPEVEPIIFDIIDDHPLLKRHYATRKKVYKKVGGAIINMSKEEV